MGCGLHLRVTDEDSGKDAKCPECGTIQPVRKSSSRDDQTSAPGDAVTETDNPFRSPSGLESGDVPVQADRPDVRLTPTTVRTGDVLRYSWDIFRRNLGLCVLFSVTMLGVVLGLELIMFGVLGVLTLFDALDPLTADLNTLLMALLMVLVAGFVVLLGVTWIQCGQALFMLRVARGEEARLGDLFSGGPFVLRAFGLILLTGILILMLFLLVAAPFVAVDLGPVGYAVANIVVYLASLYIMLALYFLVDQDQGVVESLRSSLIFMRGNKRAAFLMHLAVGFGCMAFVLVTCFLGSVFVLPFALLVLAVFYVAATGQLPLSSSSLKPSDA